MTSPNTSGTASAAIALLRQEYDTWAFVVDDRVFLSKIKPQIQRLTQCDDLTSLERRKILAFAVASRN